MSLAVATNDEPRKHAASVQQYLKIITHPAFRLGFLDYRGGSPLAHDDIRARVERGTDPAVLAKFRRSVDRWTHDDVRHAQIRYEEGRFFAATFDVGAVDWTSPEAPPASVLLVIAGLAKAGRRA